MLQKFIKKPSSLSIYITIGGEFNPSIFQPYWLVKQNLVGENEIPDNSVEIISSKVTSIKLDYCVFRVTKNDIRFQTDQLGFLTQSLDLLNGILMSLKTIPIYGAEISLYTHYDLKDKGKIKAFFQKLSPNDFWTNTLEEFQYKKIKVTKKKDGKYPSDVDISITPCPKSDKEIHLNLDDQYDWSKEGIFFDAKKVKLILDKEITTSLNHSIDIINKITHVF